MYVIAGLGNPTAKYAKTRHNVGFDVIDELAEKFGIAVRDKKFKAEIGSGYIEGVKVMLVKPQTFMNSSGESIQEIASYYNIDVENELIIVYDDISLEPGFLRIRKKGSAGGHNGIKSIIACLGTQDFQRVRVGIGEKPAGWDLADYVLGRFGSEEREKVDGAIGEAAEAVTLMVQGNTDDAMNRFNSKKPRGEHESI